MYRTALHRSSLVLLALLCLTLPAVAQTKAERIDDLVHRYHEYGLFNGAVLVAEEGETIYEAGLGDAVMEWDVPNAPDTKFRIGSVTKQFTAALVLQLVESGDVDLQGTIRDYVPEYPAKHGDRVTIHQLLTHTSGIPSYTGFAGMEDFKRDPFDPDSFITKFWDLDLEFEPGSRWSYNNSAYYLLGVILERVTGMPYDRLLEERILEPLGLDDTGYDHYHEVIEGMAEGYARDGLGYGVADYLDTNLPYSAGMMYSTPRDLLEWDRALSTGTGPFRSAETKALFFAPHAPMGQAGMHYAYGWIIQPTPMGPDTVEVVQHGGGIDGFTTAFWRIPADGRTIVVMDNTSSDRTDDLAEDLARILYDQPVELPKRPIAALMAEAIESEGWDVAVERYRELKGTANREYDFGEAQLNRLGYHYLRKGDVTTAIRIFELNVEMFPDAFNPWDSLAEAYLEADRPERAIEYYEKSLQLNPGNANAKRMLRERLGVEWESSVEVDASVLERYVGRYDLMPGMVLEITLADGTLHAQATGQPRVPLAARSETEFIPEGVNARIVFDPEGASLTLFQGGREMEAARIAE